MKLLIEEYGDSLLTCIFGSIIIVFLSTIVLNYFDMVYPTYNNTSVSDFYNESVESISQPVLLIEDQIRIPVNDDRYNAQKYANNRESDEYKAVLNNYKALATAYESSENMTTIDVDVYKIEKVNISKRGATGDLIYKATNSNGHTIQRRIHYLVN